MVLKLFVQCRKFLKQDIETAIMCAVSFLLLKSYGTDNLIEEVNKRGTKTIYQYDGNGRAIKVGSDNRTVSYRYDPEGNIIYKTIGDHVAKYEYGYTNRYVYDGFDQRIQWIKPDGTTIRYRYDALGNLIAKNDATYTYDSRNNLLTAQNKAGTIKNTYDAFDHLIKTIDPSGNTILYGYDKDNRLISKEYQDVSQHIRYNQNNQIDAIYDHDRLIARYGYNQRNEITTLIQQDVITQKSYDEMSRVTSQVSKKQDQVVLRVSYEYDANDNLIKEEIDGKVNTYQYDAYDELIKSHKYVDGGYEDTS